MKKYLSSLAALVLLFSCTPENKPSATGSEGGTQNNSGELIITGDALITSSSITLTGYANLPLEWKGAEVGIMYDKNQSFAEAERIAATSLDGNNGFAIALVGLASSTTYYYKSYVIHGMAVKYGAVKAFTTKESRPEAVDLGLSVKWATCNIGASKPEEYGDYYAWGETEIKTNYSSSNYKFGSSSFSMYSTVDGKTVLDPADDVAHVKLRGGWRMPTDAEWAELMDNCTWTWTSNYNRTGVAGRIVKSRKMGYTSNSIFLPAAGFRNFASLSNTGSYGDYWSSSLNTDSPYNAWSIGFSSGSSGSVGWDSRSRYYGQSVRPVSE